MKNSSSITPVLLTLVVLFLLPVLAHACPLCQGGGTTKDTVTAYKGITALLALIPIIGGSALFYWLYVKYKNNGE